MKNNLHTRREQPFYSINKKKRNTIFPSIGSTEQRICTNPKVQNRKGENDHHAVLGHINRPNTNHLFQPGTLGDWEPRAKRLGRSLGAYTPAPLTPYFMGALVLDKGPLPGLTPRNGCLFSGEASSLDAFSSYPQRRGCPATALSDNWLTRGHSVPFLSY